MESSDRQFHERVWPPAWVWILAVALGSGLGIAYGAAYGLSVGVIVLVPAVGLPLVALAATSPVVALTDHRLQAGRAVIPTSALARCAPLDGAGMARALRLSDPSMFTMVRPWSVRSGVLIEVSDPADPHTSWLIATRRAERLVRILESYGVDVVADRMR